MTPISLNKRKNPRVPATIDTGIAKSMSHLLRHFQTKKKVIGDAISGKKRIIETVRAKSSMGLVLFFLNAGEIQEVRVLSTPRIVGEFL